MDDLAKELGISKRTLYEIFESKEKLFYSIVEKELDRIESLMLEVMSKIEKENDDLIPHLNQLWEINIETTKIFTREFVVDMRKHVPEAWKLFEKFRSDLLQANFYKIAESGIRNGVFKPDLKLDIVYLMHTNLFNNILNPETIASLPYSLKEVMETINMVLFTGVFTDYARERYAQQCKNNNCK